jgi:hypothetical protein
MSSLDHSSCPRLTASARRRSAISCFNSCTLCTENRLTHFSRIFIRKERPKTAAAAANTISRSLMTVVLWSWDALRGCSMRLISELGLGRAAGKSHVRFDHRAELLWSVAFVKSLLDGEPQTARMLSTGLQQRLCLPDVLRAAVRSPRLSTTRGPSMSDDEGYRLNRLQMLEKESSSLYSNSIVITSGLW